MDGIIPKLSRPEKRRLQKSLRKCRDAELRTRIQIILNLADGRSPTQTAAAVCVSRMSVYRVAGRFRDAGQDGLIDGRRNNGKPKVDGAFLSVLAAVVGSAPGEHGWKRPTWTREMFVSTMAEETGVTIHVATMSHALKRLGARRGRPKPTVGCPWPKCRKNKRIRELKRLVENLPPNEVVLYEDEVDIHLNPKIGLDWMLPGQQKQLMTPGKNVKRYLAGAYNPHSGELLYVEADRKNTLLFIQLLWKLVTTYTHARVIHVILDNYGIHDTCEVRRSLETPQGRRLRLHFLPPYCPDHNRIERVWQDLHANVTRNHTCTCIEELMREVRNWMDHRSKPTAQRQLTA